MEVLTEEFEAESQDGERYRLVTYTDTSDARSKEGPASFTGKKRTYTSDGHYCIQIDDDTFEIIRLGCKVKRVKDV